MSRLKEAVRQAVGTMVDDPANPYRQGYTFANALNAVSELHNLTRIEEAIVAEDMAKHVALFPDKFSIFDPREIIGVYP